MSPARVVASTAMPRASIQWLSTSGLVMPGGPEGELGEVHQGEQQSAGPGGDLEAGAGEERDADAGRPVMNSQSAHGPAMLAKS